MLLRTSQGCDFRMQRIAPSRDAVNWRGQGSHNARSFQVGLPDQPAAGRYYRPKVEAVSF
jgi:hypothetical protein